MASMTITPTLYITTIINDNMTIIYYDNDAAILIITILNT